MDVPYSIIELFEGQEKIHGDAFRQLRDVAIRCSGLDVSFFKKTCKNLENEYLTKKYPDFFKKPVTEDGIALLTKRGGWRYRVLLPNAYISAKSVLTRAFSKGLDLNLGKSALQKELRPKEGTKKTYTYYLHKTIELAPNEYVRAYLTHLVMAMDY